jgi:hypothetical protein
MSNYSDEQVVIDFQTIHDQYIIRSFNNPTSIDVPQVGLIILRDVKFGVVFI